MVAVRAPGPPSILEVHRELGAGRAERSIALRRITQAALELTGASTGVIAVPDGDHLQCVAASGTAASAELENLRLRIEGSISGAAVRTGRTVVCDDAFSDPGADRARAEATGVRAGLAVPIVHVADGAVVGVLSVASDHVGAFDQTDVELLEVLARVTAQAMSGAPEQNAAAAVATPTATRSLFETLSVPAWVFDLDSLAILEANDAALAAYGFRRDEVAGMTMLDLRSMTERERFLDAQSHLPPELVAAGVFRHRRKDGSELFVDVHTGVIDYRGRPARFALMHDVTGRMRRLDGIQQREKAEATGRLAGGIAHDFNNLLSVVLAETDDLLEQMDAPHRWRAQLENVRAAGRRAAELTRQLLAYGGRQRLEPRTVQLNSVVRGMWNAFAEVLGPETKVVLDLEPMLGLVEVDRTKIEQVLLDLASNARDAMADAKARGVFTVTTRNVTIEDPAGDVRPGPVVRVAVSDTGRGMSREIAERAFDPFFTTKEVGQGSGLGLSTALGILRQSGGALALDSTEGLGTTVAMVLPRTVESATATALPQSPAHVSTDATDAAPASRAAPRTPRILVVDDDGRVRATVARILRSRSYVVEEAGDGEEALEVLGAAPPGAFAVVLSDVVMPRLDGPGLGAALRERHPEIPVAFMSAYAADAAARTEQAAEILRSARFLQKPFTPAQLLAMVGEMAPHAAAGGNGEIRR